MTDNLDEQWSLEQCVNYTLVVLDNEDREYLRVNGDAGLHHTMGRWIRNECGLWKHGTDKVVADIVREYKAGRLKSKLLDENQLIHPELPYALENIRANPPISAAMYVERELTVPDNCSAVIIEVIVQRICNGNG